MRLQVSGGVGHTAQDILCKRKKEEKSHQPIRDALTCALVVLALLGVGVEANRLREVIVSANK